MNDTNPRLLRAIDRLAGPNGDEGYPTAREIAERLYESPSTVATWLRWHEEAGHVTKMGEAFNGARTWAVTAVGQAALQNAGNP